MEKEPIDSSIWGQKKMTFLLKDGDILHVRLKDILYFERNQRLTKIITEKIFYETKEGISDIEKRLSIIENENLQKNFVRCHNSYIVSLPAVQLVKKNAFVLDNGTEIAISRPYQGKMKGIFLEWASEN